MLDVPHTACPVLTMTVPAASTRSNPLEHLFVSVLDAAPLTSDFRLAFDAAGVSTFTNILDMTKDDWRLLSWLTSAGDPKKLSIVAVNTLVAVQSRFVMQATNDENTLLLLTRAILSEWRHLQAACPAVAALAASAPAPAPAPVRSGSTVFGSSSGSLSAADEFKKGIKRDIAAFFKFKD